MIHYQEYTLSLFEALKISIFIPVLEGLKSQQYVHNIYAGVNYEKNTLPFHSESVDQFQPNLPEEKFQ